MAQDITDKTLASISVHVERKKAGCEQAVLVVHQCFYAGSSITESPSWQIYVVAVKAVLKQNER